MNEMRLSNVCEITMGQAPEGASYNFDGNGLPLLAGAGDFGDHFPSPSKFTTSPGKISKKEDIIVCIRATIGDLNWSDREYCLGRGVAGLRPKKELDKQYLWNWLQASKDKLEKNAKGSTFKQISRNDIASLQIPIPPLDEQKRIAAILDKADAIRGKRAESLKLLDELLRATFLDMFGTSENKGWNETTVGEITGDQSGAIRTGPFGSQLLHSEFVDEGIAVLGIDNAVYNEFRWAKPRFISPEKYQQLKRYTVRPGDVLITIMGTCGRCAIVPGNCPPAINTKHLCCITLNQKICLPEFLHSFFLMHPKAKYYLKQTAKGAIMDGLNMALIKAMPIILPPIALQKKYSELWHKIQKSKQQFCAYADESDTLFHSLVARAFKGEL